MNSELNSKVKNFLSGTIPGLDHFAECNAKAYHAILADLKEHNLVPFWGAGFVAELFPTWSTLLKNIVEKWDLDLSNVEDNYEECAQHIIKELGKNIFTAELTRIFSQPRCPLSPSRSRIREIFRNYHITTNLDQTIEHIPARGMPPIRALLPQELEQNSELVSLSLLSKHCLIKLHGDIQMRDNIILSKKSYDKYYPTIEPYTDVQQVLTSVLMSAPVIFIGCSLEQDRALQIIERYAKLGCRFYALLPLPEGTANVNDPYMPLIRERRGRKEYLSRMDFLAERNITPIWYPYGEHDFVDAFLDLLHGEVVAHVQVEYQKLDYLPDKAYIGRKQEMEALYQTLEHGRIAWVSGGPGIGKSQLCRQVMARRQAENPARVYLTVDCLTLSAYKTLDRGRIASGPLGLGFGGSQLAHHVMARRQAEPTAWMYLTLDLDHLDIFSLEALYLSCILACNPKANMEAVQKSGEPLRAQALRLCAEAGSLGLLIDNFEILNDAACKGAFSLDMIEFFCDLHGQGVELIMASRYSDMQCKEQSPSWARFRDRRDQIVVPPLSDAEACALFEYYVEGNLVCEGDDFEQLLSLVQGHPMSIKLVMGLLEDNTTWGYLLEYLKNNSGKETTVTISCRRAWAQLQGNEKAMILWGGLAWSTQPLPLSWIYGKGKDAQLWNAALGRLARLNLVSVKDDRVTMLIPIKQEFHKMERAGEGELFDQLRAAWWVERIGTLAAGEFNPEMIQYLSEILQLMTKLLPVCDVEDITRLSENLWRYYETDLLASEQFLGVLTSSADLSEDARLRAAARVGRGICCYFRDQYDEAIRLFGEAGAFYASVDDRSYAYCLWRKGDAARMCAQYDDAMALYQSAEQLYVQMEDNLGLAQTLWRMGDIAGMRDEYGDAMTLYERAEQLYVQVEDDRGLAQTLWSMGEVARMRGQYDEAMRLYERVEQLYVQVEDNLGLAQTLKSMGDVACMSDEYNDAMVFYQRAEKLYDQVENYLGLAQTLKSMGDVARMHNEYDVAVVFFQRAERLYVQVEDNLGLTQTLWSMGHVAALRAQYDEAMLLFQRAECLYVQVEDNRGLADTVKSIGDVARMRAQYDIAVEFYERAERLYVQVEDNSGLAYTLKSMGDVARMRAQYDDAVVFYQRAERLYNQVKDNLGLAHTLKSMGDVARMRDHYDESVIFYQRAERLYAQVEDNLGLAHTLKSMGDVAYMRDHYDEAVTFYKRAECLYSKVENNLGLAQTLKSIGDVEYMRDMYDDAIEFYERAEQLYLKVEDNHGLAYLMLNQGQIFYMRDQEIIALEYYDKAEKMFIQLGDQYGEAYACEYKSNALSIIRRHDEARQFAERAAKIRSEIG